MRLCININTLLCAAAANPVYGLAGSHSAVVLFYEVAPISLVGDHCWAVQGRPLMLNAA